MLALGPQLLDTSGPKVRMLALNACFGALIFKRWTQACSGAHKSKWLDTKYHLVLRMEKVCHLFMEADRIPLDSDRDLLKFSRETKADRESRFRLAAVDGTSEIGTKTDLGIGNQIPHNSPDLTRKIRPPNSLRFPCDKKWPIFSLKIVKLY